MTTKLSISLPDDDVAFLDGMNESSRSAAIHTAIKLARSLRLADDYAAAFDEWEASGDAELWDGVTGDGITQ